VHLLIVWLAYSSAGEERAVRAAELVCAGDDRGTLWFFRPGPQAFRAPRGMGSVNATAGKISAVPRSGFNRPMRISKTSGDQRANRYAT